LGGVEGNVGEATVEGDAGGVEQALVGACQSQRHASVDCGGVLPAAGGGAVKGERAKELRGVICRVGDYDVFVGSSRHGAGDGGGGDAVVEEDGVVGGTEGEGVRAGTDEVGGRVKAQAADTDVGAKGDGTATRARRAAEDGGVGGARPGDIVASQDRVPVGGGSVPSASAAAGNTGGSRSVPIQRGRVGVGNRE